MSRIFNAYLEGEDRDYAIMEAESNMIFNKLFTMLEMVDMKLELNKEAAEYKVLKESGTYEDLQYLYTEAQKEAEKEKKGIIQTIIDAIGSVLNSIINGVKNFFSKDKTDPNATVDVDGEAWDKCQKMESFWQKLQPAFSDPKRALITITAALALIGGTTFVGGKVVKKVKVSARNAMAEKLNNISSSLKQKIDNITPDFLKNTMGEVWKKVKEIPTLINTLLSKLGIHIGKNKNTDTNANTTDQPATTTTDNNTTDNANNTTTESVDDELLDSDLDAFLEHFLSLDDDSLFEEDAEDNIVLEENEIEDLQIGGISVKDQLEIQESMDDSLIEDEEMSEIRSLFESLENEEID